MPETVALSPAAALSLERSLVAAIDLRNAEMGRMVGRHDPVLIPVRRALGIVRAARLCSVVGITESMGEFMRESG